MGCVGCMALGPVALGPEALGCVALGCVALDCVALGCVALDCVALDCVALGHVALGCVALGHVALGCVVLGCVALGCTSPDQLLILEQNTISLQIQEILWGFVMNKVNGLSNHGCKGSYLSLFCEKVDFEDGIPASEHFEDLRTQFTSYDLQTTS